MNLLYIDANIYLEFYNTNKPEFKKLLASVAELTNKIFFTKQFANEIDRNKLNVFRRSIENYSNKGSVSQSFLPEHLDEDSQPKLADWNKRRKKLDTAYSKSNDELSVIFNDILKQISDSQDAVSKSLNALYSTAISATVTELEKARLRYETGNPPGKSDNPLGDQLSWEMLLSVVPKTTKLWIVSNDYDYFTEHYKKQYLNPVLSNDLKSLNSDVEVKIFTKLSEALRDFSSTEKITSIPTSEELDIISITETIGVYDTLDQNSKLFLNNFANNKTLEIDTFDLKLIKLIAKGMSIEKISQQFKKEGMIPNNISNIEKHLNRLKSYLQANNTVHLVAIAKDMGLI